MNIELQVKSSGSIGFSSALALAKLQPMNELSAGGRGGGRVSVRVLQEPSVFY